MYSFLFNGDSTNTGWINSDWHNATYIESCKLCWQAANQRQDCRPWLRMVEIHQRLLKLLGWAAHLSPCGQLWQEPDVALEMLKGSLWVNLIMVSARWCPNKQFMVHQMLSGLATWETPLCPSFPYRAAMLIALAKVQTSNGKVEGTGWGRDTRSIVIMLKRRYVDSIFIYIGNILLMYVVYHIYIYILHLGSMVFAGTTWVVGRQDIVSKEM